MMDVTLILPRKYTDMRFKSLKEHPESYMFNEFTPEDGVELYASEPMQEAQANKIVTSLRLFEAKVPFNCYYRTMDPTGLYMDEVEVRLEFYRYDDRGIMHHTVLTDPKAPRVTFSSTDMRHAEVATFKEFLRP